MSVKVGTAGANTAKSKKNYARLKQGTAVYRILPPLGDLAEKGIWSSWHEVIFGYKTAEGYMRPFESCEVRNRKNRAIIEVRDPARDEIEKFKADEEKLKGLLKKDPKNLAVQKALNTVKEYLDVFNLDKAHYVNAISLSGEVTLLRLGYKEMLNFRQAREKLIKEDGIDPIGVSGAFMQFDKNGMGLDVVVNVAPFMERQGNAKIIKTHELDEAELDKVAAGYFELDEIYPRPTPEEIERMATPVDPKTPAVKDGDVIGEIMDSYRTENTKAPVAAPAPKAAPKAPVAKAATKAAPAPAVVAEVVEEAPVEHELPAELSMEDGVEEEASFEEGDSIMDVIRKTPDLGKALSQDRKTIEAKTVSAPVAKPAAKAAPAKAAPTEMSAEEKAFMEEYGIGTEG